MNIQAYADDLVLLSPSSSGLQKLLGRAGELLAEEGLVLNVRKIVAMVFRPKPLSSDDHMKLTLYDKSINFVDSFKYLGLFYRKILPITVILIGVINRLTEVQVSYWENLILLIQIFYFRCLIRTVLHPNGILPFASVALLKLHKHLIFPVSLIHFHSNDKILPIRPSFSSLGEKRTHYFFFHSSQSFCCSDLSLSCCYSPFSRV